MLGWLKHKGRKEKGNIKETIAYTILGIVIAFLINQTLAFALSTDMPIVAVESNSMVPTFYRGDILIIQGVRSPEDYANFLNVGDIIVFSPEGHEVPVVHRIIKINPDGTYQTMGDANNNRQLPFEKRIRPEQIHGKMIFRIPYLGWVKIGFMDYVLPNMVPISFIIIVSLVFYNFYVKRY